MYAIYYLKGSILISTFIHLFVLYKCKIVISLKPLCIKTKLSGWLTQSYVDILWNLGERTLLVRFFSSHFTINHPEGLLSVTFPQVLPSPTRVKAKWTHTGWLAIRTTVCRMTVWFATGIPIWPERRRQRWAVKSLWAMWVELVQFFRRGDILPVCSFPVLSSIFRVLAFVCLHVNTVNVHLIALWLSLHFTQCFNIFGLRVVLLYSTFMRRLWSTLPLLFHERYPCNYVALKIWELT